MFKSLQQLFEVIGTCVNCGNVEVDLGKKYCPGCGEKLVITRGYEVTEMSVSQVQTLEQRLDALFSRLGIDVVFSKHFIERLSGREKDIEPEEIYDAFTKFLKKYGEQVYMSKHLSGVLKDMGDDINIPFSIDMSSKGKKLYTITVMRKHDFKSYGGDKEFQV